MNPIQERINKIKDYLKRERGSGRTNHTLDQMVEFVVQATPGQKIILFASSQDIANGIQRRFVDRLPLVSRVRFIGNAVEANGVLVYFKSEEYQNNPSYKYEKWECSYTDNSIYDKNTAEYLRYLQRELALSFL